MELIIHKNNQTKIAELKNSELILSGTEDFVDLMGNAGYLGARHIIIHESNLLPEFFDLKTRIAGEILQKFSNYNQKLAIVGEFTKYNSRSLADFIRESNKTGRILFVDNRKQALKFFKEN